MQKTYTIYKLVDPRDKTIRYVGMTTNPELRLGQHIYTKQGNTKKDAWIKDLRENGYKPQMETIEETTDEKEARRIEAGWCAWYFREGQPILNR